MTRRMSLPPFPARRSTRAAAVAAVGLFTTLGLSGCQWTSPITTQLQYDAAEGKSVQVGDVRVLNAVVVAKAKDAPGVLSASFVNPTAEKRTVQVRVGEQTVGSIDVPAGQTVAVGGPAKPLQIAKVRTAPGGMTDVVFATQPTDATPASLAVLAPQGPYATVTPVATPSAPPATTPPTSPATTAPDPAATGSPAPTASAPTAPTETGSPAASSLPTTTTAPPDNTLPATSPSPAESH